MISKPNRLAWVFGWLLAFASVPASASLNVFACEPEWASLVSALLPNATITTATTAWQDPHYIEARPSLIAAMRKADLAVCTGASLEAGWLPSLISRAANRKIQPGSAHLRNVLATPDLARASVIIVASYQDDRPARWLSSQSGVPAIVLPGTVTGQPGEETLEQVINLIVDTLLNHQEPTNVE
jgi:hypothetical protein